MINNCVDCGATFEAKTKSALYCPICRKKRMGYKKAKRRSNFHKQKIVYKDKFVPTLLKLMAENNLSICQTAHSMGLSNTGLNNWIYGAGTPNMKSLIKLSKFFGVSIDYLVFGEEK